MNILVTGAKGFIGRNLVENLKCIRDGKNRTRGNLDIGNIYEYDIESTIEQLDAYCTERDFVFNLAGVNRPKNPTGYRTGNYGFAITLLEALKKHNNRSPVMLSSSIQASLAGRFGTSEYGISKRDSEELFLIMRKRLGYLSMYIVFQILWVSGYVRTTTLLWVRFAIILLMICQFLSLILELN